MPVFICHGGEQHGGRNDSVGLARSSFGERGNRESDKHRLLNVHLAVERLAPVLLDGPLPIRWWDPSFECPVEQRPIVGPLVVAALANTDIPGYRDAPQKISTSERV